MDIVRLQNLLGSIPYVLVSTADPTGQPHVAIGRQVTLTGDSLLIFENWFCPATLENIASNSQVAIVAFQPDSGSGVQLLGAVVRSVDVAMLDGFEPLISPGGIPQVLTRFVVRIGAVFEFTAGIHTDIPLA